MTQLNYRIAKDYMRETREQAHRDHLARKLQPGFRRRVAKVFTALATRLEPKTQNQPAEFVPFHS